MKFSHFWGLFLGLTLLAGCVGPGASETDATSTPLYANLPTPAVRVTSAPDAKTAINAFMEAWKADDYASMYAMITSASQETISAEDFDKRYRSAMNSLTLSELVYEITSSSLSPTVAQVGFRVTYKTHAFGEFVRDLNAGLELENGGWKIEWEDGLVMPDLRGGNRLDISFDDSITRGIIYDRKNVPFVAQTDAYAIGLTPSLILPEQEGTLLGELGQLMGIPSYQVLPIYDNQRDVYWPLPIGEAPAEAVDRRIGLLSSISGLTLTKYEQTRFYYYNGIAPQTIGYVSAVPAERRDEYVRLGYSPAARVGSSGIELWGDKYLSGKTGGTLYVVDSTGKIISPLGTSPSEPASDIYLTLDRDLQLQAQKAIQGFRGSIVVMERDTGRVLAMVSSPGYDPNLFEPNNTNNEAGITAIFNDANQPLVNRAAQGQLPLGSVFKVITFVAALESGTYTPDLKINCGYEWTDLSDKVRYDWTWEHFQDELRTTGEGKTRPSGELTLTEGLMRSCNPWFWHIGLDLYRQGRVTAVADMARAFGLGQPTGIGVIDEAAGQINNPGGDVEAVNQAIGQGDVLVTPLQVATFMAAIGNDGTLYRPQLIEKNVDANGVETTMFKPEARGTLPLKPETLEALREAMWGVVHSTKPAGTAVHRFRSYNIPIYAKTGTAESGNGLPHAWFAGYTDAQNPDLPDIAIAVVVENQGEGSDYGAPIFKRICDIYFTGQPRYPYWWETNIGMTKTPTPLGYEGTQPAEAPNNP